MLVIDFDGCDAGEILEAYRDLALLFCAPAGNDAVLLKTGREDAEVHFALHDVVHTLARVVGAKLQVRVALVGSSMSMAEVCSQMQAQLRALGCEVRLFDQQSGAERWLLVQPPAAPAGNQEPESPQQNAGADEKLDEYRVVEAVASGARVVDGA